MRLNFNRMKVNDVMTRLEMRHPGEQEFLQAVREVLTSIEEVYNMHPEFEKAAIVERIVEPDRVFIFRVPWTDDNGQVHVNIGYRVQFNGAIDSQGGIRYPSVSLSSLKFLGFEQTFKNAPPRPHGGKRGSPSPKGRSQAEIMRFCQSFVTELWRDFLPRHRCAGWRYRGGGTRSGVHVWNVQEASPRAYR